MSRGAVDHLTHCNNPHCSVHCSPDQRIHLELQYTDKKHNIDLDVKVTSPPDITVLQVTKDLMSLLYLDDIPPEEIRLVGFSRNDQYCQLSIMNPQRKIQDLGMTSDCTLYFEPTPTAAPPKPCHLVIVAPDGNEKVYYEWYRETTTLDMLLTYIIEKLSLQSVARERIHLVTIIRELNLHSGLSLRLSEWQLFNGMSVYVQIIPPLSPTTVEENISVHVEYTYDNDTIGLDIPNTETIRELKSRIQKRIEDRHIVAFKLFNEAKEELVTDDSGRTLKSFGVKPGQTLSASFRTVSRKTQSTGVNNQSEASTTSSPSMKTKEKHETVTVICKFPSSDPETLQVSINDTVRQLMNKIETFTHNQRLVLSEMGSATITIDFQKDKETCRCLADLGFKPDDVIKVTLKEKSPTYSSIVSKQPSTSPKEDKQPKASRAVKKPIGLNNLGNSCYLNSALQCLAHVPQLTQFFLEGIDHAHMDDDEYTDNDWNPYDEVGSVTGAYADLLWNLWRCDQNDYTYDTFKPNRIKAKIGEKDSRFGTTDQQDAQEFMSFFLEAIHQELKAKNRNGRNTIIDQLFFGEMTSTITCTACSKEESTTHPISFLSIPLSRQERTFYINYIPMKGEADVFTVHVPIGGRIEHVVDIFTQSKGQPKLFFYILVLLPDGELDLKTPLSEIPTDEMIFMEQEERCNNARPKPLESTVKTFTLTDCLREFFSPEGLEDGWICQQAKCKKKTFATKQLKLRKPPPVIIIQFKRFSHENGLHQKVETFVEYPLKGLNLRDVLPSLQKEAIYDLIAVCNHMGSISGGHYIAYARHSILNKTEWYRFDDSSVTRVKPEYYEYDIISRNAYLLFYIQRDLLNPVTPV